MPQSQYNTAQIDMMVRTIHSLKDEAAQIHTRLDDNPPTTPVPQLIITSRPRNNVATLDGGENTRSDGDRPSADIIDIMDRISALAADGEAVMQQSNTGGDVPNIGDLLTRIHILLDEANDTSTDMTSKSDIVATEIAPVSDAGFATQSPILPEPHKLDENTLEAEDVDAAMQDIEIAVRNAAPAGPQTKDTMDIQSPDTENSAADAGSLTSPSENLKTLIRDEVHSVLKAELPDAVRTIVRKTLKDEGYTPPQREKIRTRRFRNT